MKLQKNTYRIAPKTSSQEKPVAEEASRPKQSATLKDQFVKISGAALKMDQMLKPALGGSKGPGGDLVAAQPVDLPRTLGGGVKGTGGDLVAATPINLPRTSGGGVKGSGGDLVAAQPVDLPRTSGGGVKGSGGDSVAATPINLPKTLDGGVIDPRSSSPDLTPEDNRPFGGIGNPEESPVGVLPIPLPKSSADAMLEIEKDLRELEAAALNSRIQEKQRYLSLSSNKSKAGQDSQRAAIDNVRS